jgi:GST-like protein
MSVSYELIGAPTGNCLRAAIALEVAGLPYASRRLDLRKGEQRSPAHLQLDPLGKVPVLVSMEAARPLVLRQSNAIMLFAADAAPGVLLPADPWQRASVYEPYFFVLTDIIAPNHAAFHLRQHDLPAPAGMLQRRALEKAAYCETLLATSSFLAGDRFSIADIAAFTVLRSMLTELNLAQLPRVSTWLRAVGELPAVQRGMAAFD